MEGGAPAAALLDAAKGSVVYVSLWSKGPAEPFDLAGGVLLVRGAVGDVLDADGKPIDPVAHAGPFIAGVHGDALQTVSELVRPALGARSA